MREHQVTATHFRVKLILATPVSPRPHPFLVLFASGDGGLKGVSRDVMQHLADQGYYVAAFNSREALNTFTRVNGMVAWHVALASMTSLFEEAKRGLNLPDATPAVVTGMSRGANLVIAAAATPTLRAGFLGGVAMALTRELDYLDLPVGADQRPWRAA